MGDQFQSYVTLHYNEVGRSYPAALHLMHSHVFMVKKAYMSMMAYLKYNYLHEWWLLFLISITFFAHHWIPAEAQVLRRKLELVLFEAKARECKLRRQNQITIYAKGHQLHCRLPPTLISLQQVLPWNVLQGRL